MNGSVQTFTAPVDGWYSVDVWGATGDWGYNGGGHTYGEFHFTRGQTVYVCVGGGSGNKNGGNFGGWNGAGTGEGHNVSEGSGSSGGATDVRLNAAGKGSTDWRTGLYDRIIVGGGGGGGFNNSPGGDGGGWTGGYVGEAQPGTQSSGYAFGEGQGTGRMYFGAGGGGWYGGHGSYNKHGAGGSSYVSGISGGIVYTSVTARTGWSKTGANSLDKNIVPWAKGSDLPARFWQMWPAVYKYHGGEGAASFTLLSTD